MATLSLDCCRGRLINNVRELGQRRPLSYSHHRHIHASFTSNNSTGNGPIADNKLQNTSLSRTEKLKCQVWATFGKYSAGSSLKRIESLHLDVPNVLRGYLNKVPFLRSKSHDEFVGTQLGDASQTRTQTDENTTASVQRMTKAGNTTGSVKKMTSANNIVEGSPIKDPDKKDPDITKPKQEADAKNPKSTKAGNTNNLDKRAIQEKEVSPKIVAVQETQDSTNRAREQHDFEGAMSDNYEMVEKYYSHSTLPHLQRNAEGLNYLAREKEIKQGLAKNEAVLKVQRKDQTTTNVETPAQVDKTKLHKAPTPDSTAQKFLKTAGATVAGSQSLISDAYNRLPKMPNMMPSRHPSTTAEVKQTTKTEVKKLVIKVPRIVHERRTKDLTVTLKVATTDASRLTRLEDLCVQLAKYPETRGITIQENIIPVLLKMRNSTDLAIQQQANQALGLLGYINPVKGRGIKILALDGGGTKGFYTIELLRQLEKTTGKKVPEMFDLICGVSTGAILSTLLGAKNASMDECEGLYRTFSREVLAQGRLPGITNLIWSHAYYDSNSLAKSLRHCVGDLTYLDSMKTTSIPKFFAVSSIMNTSKIENFLFRNYQYPIGTNSRYPGSLNYKLWEAVRASSAAPGYYDDLKLGQHIHMDGGLLSNNPTAIALHEAKLLWPNASLQCVVSVGTGRFQPVEEYKEVAASSLREKLHKVIQSATDTEGVHTTLHDLLPPRTYYRFNPYMLEDNIMDETRDEKWDQMFLDTKMYIHKNRAKFESCSRQLLLEKTPPQKLCDTVKLNCDKYASSWLGSEKVPGRM